MRVGGTSIIPIDVRIVAATNESLERKVAEGTFRRDLYYRLSTLPIVIPPLSERGDDLFLILEQFQKELGGSFRLTPQVRGFLKSYSWPGNIRELRNVVEYFLYTDHDPITMEDLPPTVFHRAPQAPIRQLPETPQQPSSDVFRFVLEQDVYKRQAAHCGGDGHKHQRNHNGEQQIQEDIADGLDGGTHRGRESADQGADGDAAQNQNQASVLLPEALLLNGCHVLSPFPLFLCALLLGITGC